MTTSELIEELKEYPPNMRVIISGYEGGFNDIKSLCEQEIALDVNPEWFYGDHADGRGGRKIDETALLVK